MKVLVIGAHPDDAEYYCGGTIARYVERGDEVAICVATNGDQGHYEYLPEELACIRRGEAEKGASALGASLYWLGYRDGFLFDDEATRLAFIEVVRKVRPNVVIGHCREDYHQDHRASSQLTFIGCWYASLPHVVTESKPITEIPALYYMDGMPGTRFHPSDFVDVTAVWPRKVEAMKQHQSQVEWLGDHDGLNIDESMGVICRYRGVTCGVRYAEAFAKDESWGRFTPERLLP